MREIMFRAWDKKEEKIKFPKTLTWIGDQLDRMTTVLDDNPIYEGDDFVLMQFTGLHDKHGKEIYDGDILAYRNKMGGQVIYDNFGVVCVADFEQGKSEDFTSLASRGVLSEVEIIGNIHQNPELLRGDD